MRILIALVLCACGASPPQRQMPQDLDPSIGRPIRIEWRAEQADGGRVTVTLVVDGEPQALGLLDAETETEAGTPATCAIRAAHPLRTEFLCGNLDRYYVATLDQGELVVTFVDGAQHAEVKRIPVVGGGLAVKPYAM